MTDFATASRPLRASSIPSLFQCPQSVVLKSENPSESGEAAQTGSLIHLGIKAYHKSGGDSSVALAVMASSAPEFPRADGSKARKHFETYTKREAASWGRVILCEEPVTFEIPGLDETQAPIVIQGTLDQLRELPDGSLRLIDVKTGSKTAGAMLGLYAGQMAAYQYACQQRYPGRFVSAAILRTADFFYGGKVVHPCPWSPEQTLEILEPIRLIVAQVRAGRRISLPGTHCEYCPAKHVGNCRRGYIPSEDVSEIPSLADLLG